MIEDLRIGAIISGIMPGNDACGRVAEWFKAPVLKTGRGLCSLVSSNLTPSATFLQIQFYSATASARKCPRCGKPMKKLGYWLSHLKMDFYEDGHGFWLDADADKRSWT